MKFLAARRRSPIVASGLLVGALAVMGLGYAAIATVQPAQAALAVGTETQVEAGRQLYLEGCSSCHGLEAQGTEVAPTLVGVGAAAVDFQVSTGRMPLAAPGAQAPSVYPTYDEEQVAAMAATVNADGLTQPIAYRLQAAPDAEGPGGDKSAVPPLAPLSRAGFALMGAVATLSKREA